MLTIVSKEILIEHRNRVEKGLHILVSRGSSAYVVILTNQITPIFRPHVVDCGLNLNPVKGEEGTDKNISDIKLFKTSTINKGVRGITNYLITSRN